MKSPPTPHRLWLYRQAVQDPAAEVDLLGRIYEHYRGGGAAYGRTPRHPRHPRHPRNSRGLNRGKVRKDFPGGKNFRGGLLLREDYAGTCAVAAAWVGSHPNRQAVAVDWDQRVLKWAWREAQNEIGPRAEEDLHLVCADVRTFRGPRIDVVAAGNFSVFFHHDGRALRKYFKNLRASLRPGGVAVVDAFGGPGAMRVMRQTQPMRLPDGKRGRYVWEQKSFDAVTGRVDCRIHFELPGGKILRNAFVYDWRLWTLPELTEAMIDAGFAKAEVWSDRYDPKRSQSDGIYQPMSRMPAREDWVACVVGVR
ncbi:MAG: class I SAM-dependent methyltransferase [Phycisphaeraceae bacterium]|nr:class I SAM-dependent methyltransferase [Phycisphaeraceae bacterium]